MARLKLLLIGVLLGVAAGTAIAVEGDVVFKRKGGEGGTPPATFPHWIHRIRFKCYACHDAIFKMKQGENEVTMDAISDGKFCGACHNGKTAFSVTFESCPRCHVSR